jgi:hypothetical protein
MSELPSVLLLHDQLMDARIWNGFADLLSTHARPLTPPDAPPPSFYPVPSGWAEHIGRRARTLLTPGEPADLTIAAGWAAGAALALAADGLSRRALLINPGPTPAARDEEWAPGCGGLNPQELDPRELEQVHATMPGPLPEPTDEWADELRAGLVGPQAAAYFVAAAAGSGEALAAAHRRLAEQVVTENLNRLLPISLEQVGSADLRQEPDWLPSAGRLAGRCAVVFSGHPALYRPLQALLRQRLPELLLVELELDTGLPWLADPAGLSALTRRLLAD